MKILHLFILLLFAFVLAQKDNYVLDYDLDEGFVLETLNQIDEENSLNTSPVSNEETENSEETKVQQILPIITPQKIYQEAIKVPTKYVPTGPMTFKDSSNQPIMFNISNLDWGIITTIFVLTITCGFIIGLLSCVSAFCLPTAKAQYVKEPEEPEPEELNSRIVWKLKNYIKIPNWRNRLLPLLFGIFWFGFAGYINVFANIYVQNVMVAHHDPSKPSKPLRDIGFNILPYIPWEKGVNIVMTILIAIAIVNTLFWQKISGTLIVIRRVMLIWGFIFVLRAVSITSTILPNPDSNCKPQYFNNFFHATFLFLAGQVETCYDCLFSGHSVTMVLSVMIYYQYTKNIFLRWVMFVPLIFSLLLIIGTRFHYTVDVIYGTCIALLFFNLYHYLIGYIKERLIKNESFKNDTYFMKLLVHFFIWYESWEHFKGKDVLDV